MMDEMDIIRHLEEENEQLRRENDLLREDIEMTKIDAYGAHLHGCECDECMKVNFTCPECGRKNWFEPDMPETHECSRCMWKPGTELSHPRWLHFVRRFYDI